MDYTEVDGGTETFCLQAHQLDGDIVIYTALTLKETQIILL
ncbi:hypothetical protein QFZ80_001356 [Paenibacillus sp. V4I7]|nr:hypothetical protein [Paenibacillus sp. V4I7]